jgi:hypothetical protein
MKRVAPLRYGLIFKKAFSQPDIFTAFVRDILGIEIEIDHVETEKSFPEPVGKVDSRFDLFAEDKKNRTIVDIQHKRFPDHDARFFHYHCAALLEQVTTADDYRPALKVYTIVVLTSGDKHQKDVAVIDCDPKDLLGHGMGEIPHKVIYLCPKYVNEKTPAHYREWLAAINDTLDGEVGESHYQHPQIRHVLELIERDHISPTERARMFDEHGEEELRQEDLQKARRVRDREIAQAMRAEGFADALIGRVLGLTETELADLDTIMDEPEPEIRLARLMNWDEPNR